MPKTAEERRVWRLLTRLHSYPGEKRLRDFAAHVALDHGAVEPEVYFRFVFRLPTSVRVDYRAGAWEGRSTLRRSVDRELVLHTRISAAGQKRMSADGVLVYIEEGSAVCSVSHELERLWRGAGLHEVRWSREEWTRVLGDFAEFCGEGG